MDEYVELHCSQASVQGDDSGEAEEAAEGEGGDADGGHDEEALERFQRWLAAEKGVYIERSRQGRDEADSADDGEEEVEDEEGKGSEEEREASSRPARYRRQRVRKRKERAERSERRRRRRGVRHQRREADEESNTEMEVMGDGSPAAPGRRRSHKSSPSSGSASHRRRPSSDRRRSPASGNISDRRHQRADGGYPHRSRRRRSASNSPPLSLRCRPHQRRKSHHRRDSSVDEDGSPRRGSRKQRSNRSSHRSSSRRHRSSTDDSGSHRRSRAAVGAGAGDETFVDDRRSRHHDEDDDGRVFAPTSELMRLNEAEEDDDDYAVFAHLPPRLEDVTVDIRRATVRRDDTRGRLQPELLADGAEETQTITTLTVTTTQQTTRKAGEQPSNTLTAGGLTLHDLLSSSWLPVSPLPHQVQDVHRRQISEDADQRSIPCLECGLRIQPEELTSGRYCGDLCRSWASHKRFLSQHFRATHSQWQSIEQWTPSHNIPLLLFSRAVPTLPFASLAYPHLTLTAPLLPKYLLFQLSLYPYVSLRPSPLHGLGVFATQRIPPRTRIIPVFGLFYPRHQFFREGRHPTGRSGRPHSPVGRGRPVSGYDGRRDGHQPGVCGRLCEFGGRAEGQTGREAEREIRGGRAAAQGMGDRRLGPERPHVRGVHSGHRSVRGAPGELPLRVTAADVYAEVTRPRGLTQ